MLPAASWLFCWALLGPGHSVALQQSARDYFDSALLKQKQGDLDGALADFTKVIELDPKSAPAYNSRGIVKQMRGDLDGAIADYTKAVGLDPKSAPAYNNRAVAKQTKGDLDGALADHTKVVELDPKNALAYNNRGLVKRATGDADGALADFTKAIELNPQNALAYANRAALRYDRRAWTDALADFRRACDLPDGLHSRIRIWLIRARLGERDAATRELAQYLKSRDPAASGDWPFPILSFLTDQLSESDLFKGAASKDAKTDRRQKSQVYFCAGTRRLIDGDKQTARRYLEQCIQTAAEMSAEYRSALAELKALDR
jgi:tetratricopeptide (TPR) repeat protein